MFQLLGAMAGGFIIGFASRIIINNQQKKKQLKMENEMLKSHSRILTLQQKISELEAENQKLKDH
jgi:cell shape-determining protein MreC